jgi:hypothetical protein
MSSLSPPRRAAKGYVLIIVLVVGLAASLAAAALVNTAGHTRLTAMHTDLGEVASSIADMGMEHALAYLDRAVSSGTDFDHILDPTLLCGDPALVSIPALGGTTTTVNGKRYAVLPANGGAYLIRFDDDDDDGIDVADRWLNFTGNNEVGTNCREGPKANNSSTGNWSATQQELRRDRNRTLWVSVIGIYPGTNLATATHQRALRRLHTAPRGGSIPGLQVKGNIDIESSAVFQACSPIGSLEVDGFVSSSGSGTTRCACGLSSAHNFEPTRPGAWRHCNDLSGNVCAQNLAISGYTNTYQLPGCASGRLEAPGPDIPAIPALATAADSYIDWSRPCVFWLSNGLKGKKGGGGSADDWLEHSMWFWDADRNDGGGNSCAGYEGSLNTIPTPDPSSTGAASCWTPLFLSANLATSGGGCVRPRWNDTADLDEGDETTVVCGTAVDDEECVAVGGVSGDDAARCQWLPTKVPGVLNKTIVIAGVPTTNPEWTRMEDEMPSSEKWHSSITRLNKPDWSRCQIQYPPPVDDTIVNTQTYSCDMAGSHEPVVAGAMGETFCNGLNVAMQYVKKGVTSSFFFRPQTRAQARAVPAGVYIFQNPLALVGNPHNFGQQAHPLWFENSPKPMAGFVLATLATTHPLGILIQQRDYHFGSGQTHEGNGGGTHTPRRWLPSVIADGPVRFSGGGTSALGGSVYSTSNMEWGGNGKMFLFGEMHLNADFQLKGSGQFYWLYETPMQPVPLGTSGILPVSGLISR